MLFKFAFTAICAASTVVAAPSSIRKRTTPTGFNWSDNDYKVRGVNIGGWLVLEPWITPGIFQDANKNISNVGAIVDEYTLGQLQDDTYVANTYESHFSTWATESDFQKISQYGFNLVRIPIGFWAYDNSNTPYYKGGQVDYLDQAIGWARQNHLSVLIDLHGVPGSQNGFDNSGQRVSTPQWQTVDPGASRTLSILDQIQSKYGSSDYDDVVAGIELVNEPLLTTLNYDEAIKYEQDGFDQQRKYSQSRVVVIHDGFKAASSYNGWLVPSDNGDQNVAVDHHEYQVFTNDYVAMLPWQHRQAVCSNAASYSGADKWTIVGEWTAAMTDCAPALNGYGIGARYDQTYPGSNYVGSCDGFQFISTWNSTYKSDTRGYIEAQMETFERSTKGWIFWTFKAPYAQEWSLFDLVDNGIFPQPLTAREFGTICT